MRLISRPVGESLKERREIIVTDLDHESNIAVWLALEREGAKILLVAFQRVTMIYGTSRCFLAVFELWLARWHRNALGLSSISLKFQSAPMPCR